MFKFRNSYYDPEKQRTPWIRIAIIVFVIIMVIVVLLLIFGRGEDKRYSFLVSTAESYLSENNDKLPKNLGQCITLSVDDVRNKIDITKFKSCDTSKTYIKVCKVDSEKYQYTPFLSCKGKITKFADWHEGKVTSLKPGNSDIKFEFYPERLIVGTKNYYPNNAKDSKKVDTLYAESPAPEYVNRDLSVEAYKWYTEKETKVYYNNGALVSVQPDDFTEKSNETTKKYASLKKPSNESYRTSEQTKVYATEKVSYPYKFVCADSTINDGSNVISYEACETRNSTTFKKTIRMIYTCDGKNDVPAETVCQKLSNWSLTNCYNNKQKKTGTTPEGYNYSRQISNGDTCVSTTGYAVTDKVWKWYKNDKVRNYIPSLASDAAGENTYYVEAPNVKSIKDESTKNKVFKFYKLVDIDKSSGDWSSISDEPLSEEDLISKIKELGYDVNSLDDISGLNDIQYKIKISYCDRK